MNDLILPDSRLHDEKFGCVMMDWPVGDTIYRVEARPVFCASCGHEYGLVPTFTTFAFWLCNQCFEQYGHVVGTWEQPDMEFCRAVTEEVKARFGRELTADELVAAADQGKLGKMLELLEKESPYNVWRSE